VDYSPVGGFDCSHYLAIKISDKPKAFAFLEKVGNNENWNYRGYA
jgi:hypothetical protein